MPARPVRPIFLYIVCTHWLCTIKQIFAQSHNLKVPLSGLVIYVGAAAMQIPGWCGNYPRFGQRRLLTKILCEMSAFRVPVTNSKEYEWRLKLPNPGEALSSAIWQSSECRSLHSLPELNLQLDVMITLASWRMYFGWNYKFDLGPSETKNTFLFLNHLFLPVA